MSTYTGFEIEQRNNDDKLFLKYNKYKDAKTQKEYFMKKKSNRKKKQSKGITGKSLNKSDWDITHFEQDGEKKSKKESKDPYKKHTTKTLLKGVSVIKGGRRRKSTRKSKKKKSTRKSKKKSRKNPLRNLEKDKKYI